MQLKVPEDIQLREKAWKGGFVAHSATYRSTRYGQVQTTTRSKHAHEQTHTEIKSNSQTPTLVLLHMKGYCCWGSSSRITAPLQGGSMLSFLVFYCQTKVKSQCRTNNRWEQGGMAVVGVALSETDRDIFSYFSFMLSVLVTSSGFLHSCCQTMVLCILA